MNSRSSRIPTLLTLDIHDWPGTDRYIECSIQFLDEMDIPATYFVPARIFEKYSGQFKNIPKKHQVACHGLFHTGEEDYASMPREMQRDYVERATGILSDGLGQHPGAFRAPAFRISSTTMKVLEENNYCADVSVNSGRLGVTSTYSKENGWLFAHRVPYHPSVLDPFHSGDLSIWEVPVSALILPFTSNSVVSLGPNLSKLLVAGLLTECRLRPKPLVYMSHPEDLTENGPEHPRPKFSFSMLLPTERGIPVRQYLSAKTPQQFYRINCQILKNLKKREAIEFLTVKDYVMKYLHQSSSVSA